MSKHRSFRVTLPDHLRGKRLKPHLRGVGCLVTFFGFALSLVSFIAVAFVLDDFQWGPEAELIAGATGLVVYFLTTQITLRFLVRWNALTSTEARDFPYWEWYPDSWYENSEGGPNANGEEDKGPVDHGFTRSQSTDSPTR